MPINDRTADRWSLGVWPTSSPASSMPRFAASGLTSPTHRGLGTDAVDGKSRSPALAQIWTWPTLSAWCGPVFSTQGVLESRPTQSVQARRDSHGTFGDRGGAADRGSV